MAPTTTPTHFSNTDGSVAYVTQRNHVVTVFTISADGPDYTLPTVTFDAKYTVAPAEGLSRCGCGSKYWDANICHSCGEPFRLPTNVDDFGNPYSVEGNTTLAEDAAKAVDAAQEVYVAAMAARDEARLAYEIANAAAVLAGQAFDAAIDAQVAAERR